MFINETQKDLQPVLFSELPNETYFIIENPPDEYIVKELWMKHVHPNYPYQAVKYVITNNIINGRAEVFEDRLVYPINLHFVMK